MAETVVIITGAMPLPHVVARSVPAGATVVTADSGLDHALAAGLEPDLVVGDLDSVSGDGRRWAERRGVVRRAPTAKSSTDTELAIEAAAAYDPAHLVVIGGPDGSRLDHTLAALGAIGSPATAGIATVEAWWGATHLHVVRPGRPVTLDLPPGAVFSVLALHGPASGVTVTGARWPLDAVALPPVAGWGVSNEVTEPPAIVAVAHGIVVVIVPEGDVT